MVSSKIEVLYEERDGYAFFRVLVDGKEMQASEFNMTSTNSHEHFQWACGFTASAVASHLNKHNPFEKEKQRISADKTSELITRGSGE